MHQVLSGYVERKEMPGLVALVNHHDDVHVETLGTMSFGHLGANAARRDLSHCFACKAYYCSCGNDSGGGMQVTARRIDRAGGCRNLQIVAC